MGEETDLYTLLEMLDPKARDDLRRVLMRNQADRDAISSRLMRYRDQNGQDWADIIDFLTMWPDARRHVVRTLGELTADRPPNRPDTEAQAVCIVTLSVATEAQVKAHMRWSSGFDPSNARR